jgi:hypothetical protein
VDADICAINAGATAGHATPIRAVAGRILRSTSRDLCTEHYGGSDDACLFYAGRARARRVSSRRSCACYRNAQLTTLIHRRAGLRFANKLFDARNQ